MKKYFWAVFAVILGMTGCQGNVGTVQADTAQAALESQQTTAEVTTEQTSKIIETTASTTAAEEVSADIAVSREYEFDLEKFLECDKYDRYLLRDELDFLSDEQYDTYIKALIFVDNLGNSDILSTGSWSLYFINENGEISESYISNESDTVHIYPYFYVSTYQSFYEYLQSVFTQDAVDEIVSDERFFTFGDELYFKVGDAGGLLYFDDSEYNVIEENDSEIVFEYTAHRLINNEEWICTHRTKLVHTDNGWRSEFFENLYVERNMPYQYMVDVDLSNDYDYGRKYEFDLDKYLEGVHTEQYLLRDELEFLSDEQYDTYIKAWIFIDCMDNANGSHIPSTSGVMEDWYYYHETSLYSAYISTYESFYEYLRTVFTKEAADEIMSNRHFYNADGELFYITGEAGGYLERIEGKYELVEKSDSEVIFEYNARHIYDNGLFGYKDGTYIDTTRTIKLVKEDGGWHAELFDHLIGLTEAEREELDKQR